MLLTIFWHAINAYNGFNNLFLDDNFICRNAVLYRCI